MATILHTLKTQHKKRTIDIFLLANNYDSIDSLEIEQGNLSYLRGRILKDWNKINEKIISNGHSARELSSIKSIEDAERVAYLVLYTESQIRKKYGLEK